MDEVKTYPTVCPVCGLQMWAEKSYMQEKGRHDMGAGNCLRCGKYLRLTFLGDRMEAVFYEWLDELSQRK